MKRLIARAARGLLLASATLILAGLLGAVSAQAASGPKWRIDSVANTTAAPGSELTFYIQLSDTGEEDIPPSPGGDLENCVAGAPPPADPAKCMTFTAKFPPGFRPLRGSGFSGWSCAAPVGGTVSCSAPGSGQGISPNGWWTALLRFTVRVGKEAAGTQTSAFEVSGGEAGSASAVDPTLITKAPPAFGLDAFDALATADPSGAVLTKAGAHPDSVTTWLDFATHTEKPESIFGPAYPVEPLRDSVVDLPPGLIGNPAIAARCTSGELAGTGVVLTFNSYCPPESQVGRVLLKFDVGGRPGFMAPLPVFNMVPPPGTAARFGFNIYNTMVLIDAHVHQEADGSWTVATTAAQTSEGLGVPGVEFEFWGNPASPEHEFERACPGYSASRTSGKDCSSNAPEEAFLRMPTSCTQSGKGLPWSAHVDSWWNPGATLPGGQPDLSDPAWKSLSIESHQPPGYPLSLEPSVFPAGYSGPTQWGAPAGIEHCENEPFDPTVSAQPTTAAAESPSGFNFSIHMPQNGLTNTAPGAIAESDLKSVALKLPEGFTSNASATDGLSACSAAQIGLKSPVGQTPAVFSGGPQECPDASKVGIARIETPLLTEEGSQAERQLKGSVYLAAQHENPFGSLLALYLVIEDPQSGTILKLPGEVKADPKTGQLETIFDDNPQLPFSTVHVNLFGGPRAVLATPPTCGTYTAQVTLTPWSGNPPTVISEPIEVSSGPNGNCPAYGFEQKLAAGTANPLAGAFSAFNLNLSREDGTQELAGLSATLPPGLVAKLAGIPYCPDSVLASISSAEGTARAEEEHPSCPPASLIGRLTAGAGPGSDPFYLQSGRIYLAGPYKGAPLSLAVVVPVLAGPFDLGTVVVRNALRVNPETAQTTAVSDPFPTILYGLPVQLKDLRVEVNRPEFIINPTSCEAMQLATQLTSAKGASASPSARFQVSGCEALSFAPKLSLALKGKTSRGAHPALSATLTMPPSGQANVARAQVTLPHAEFLDQGHIQNVCTHVQYEGPGCPSSSILGYAKAWSPILEKPLEGPVYLMSGFGHKLPDVAVDLNGQIHILLHGKVDTGPGGGIRNTFEVVPDAPVSKFTLNLKGGRKGLIVNSEDLCAKPQRASIAFDGQNGKIRDSEPTLKVAGCGGKAHKRHKRRR